MATGALAVIAIMAVFLAQAAGAQGAVCTAPQVANYSGAGLVGIVGNIGWVSSYYNFTGFSAAQIIHPDAINYTRNSAPGSSYLVSANYRFDGPGGLATGPTLVFVLLNNTQAGCSSMRLFAYSDVVLPYSTAKLITARNATGAAQKMGYNAIFDQPLTLVPESNQTGIQTLAPGYSFQSSNYTVYANAENGTVSSTGNAHAGSVQAQPAGGALSGVGSSLSGIYNFFLGIFDWLRGLLTPSGG